MIDDRCSFIIGKDSYTPNLPWSTENINVPGIDNCTDEQSVKQDFNGYNNTLAISPETNNSDAAGMSQVYVVTINGQSIRGYLGAGGEYQVAYENIDTISRMCMTIGYTCYLVDQIWTSSEASSGYAWLFNGEDGSFTTEYKSYTHRAVPLFPIS